MHGNNSELQITNKPKKLPPQDPLTTSDADNLALSFSHNSAKADKQGKQWKLLGKMTLRALN